MLHKASVLPRHAGNDCYCGGIANWRVAAVNYVAKAVGLHVKIEGMPVGTIRNLERHNFKESGRCEGSSCESAGRI